MRATKTDPARRSEFASKALELTPKELEIVSAGTKPSTGHMYLVFRFKLVAVK